MASVCALPLQLKRMFKKESGKKTAETADTQGANQHSAEKTESPEGTDMNLDMLLFCVRTVSPLREQQAYRSKEKMSVIDFYYLKWTPCV